MVSVFFGKDRDAILNIDVYFNHTFEYEWLDDQFVRDMIKDIDNSIVLSNQCIQSPVLGQIPPEKLSGGVKACIIIYKLNEIVDLVVCGENCEPWLSKIFELKDCRVSMSGYDLSFKDLPIRGICENDNSHIDNYKDWVDKMCDMVGEEENER